MSDPSGRPRFEPILAEVAAAFTSDELAELALINASVSGRENARLPNLVASWGYYVRVLISQVDRAYDEPDPTVLGAYDVVGSLFTRDRVERAADLAPDALIGRVRDVIEVFDAEYHAFTADDALDEITKLGDVRRFRAGWWWHRVPERGPVRQELDQWATPPDTSAPDQNGVTTPR